jgi:Trk K+ transport system NAD-binding subunit
LSYAESAYYTATLLIGEHLIEPVNAFEMVLFVILPFFGVTIILTVAANTLLILFTKSYRKTDWLLTMAKLTNGHTVVVGFSHLGQKVVRELLKLEQEVIVIEKDETREEIMRLIERGTIPVIIGNARNVDTLMKANISRARALILTSKAEGLNMEIALKAKELNKDLKIVLRHFDVELGNKFTSALGIGMAFSTSTLSAPIFAMSSIIPEVKESIVLKDKILYFAELLVHNNSLLSGHSLEEFENECDVNVITLKRNDELLIRPDAEAIIILPGAIILVLGELENVKKAKELLIGTTTK